MPPFDRGKKKECANSYFADVAQQSTELDFGDAWFQNERYHFDRCLCLGKPLPPPRTRRALRELPQDWLSVSFHAAGRTHRVVWLEFYSDNKVRVLVSLLPNWRSWMFYGPESEVQGLSPVRVKKEWLFLILLDSFWLQSATFLPPTFPHHSATLIA